MKHQLSYPSHHISTVEAGCYTSEDVAIARYMVGPRSTRGSGPCDLPTAELVRPDMTYDGDMQVYLVGVDSKRRKEAAVLWVAYQDWKIAAKDAYANLDVRVS